MGLERQFGPSGEPGLEDLKEFQRWVHDSKHYVGGKRVSPNALDYVTINVPFASAFAVAQLVWPRFIEREGCVVRHDAFDEQRFEAWWAKYEGDVQAVESVMNHLHLLDLFPEVDGDETAEEALEQLARRMQQTWGLALAKRFPQRHFDVTLDYTYGPTLRITSVKDRDRPRFWARVRGRLGR